LPNLLGAQRGRSVYCAPDRSGQALKTLPLGRRRGAHVSPPTGGFNECSQVGAVDA
jgi:hypothetical protein